MTLSMDPQKTLAVLIGTGNYSHWPALPAVAGNLTKLPQLLADPEIIGIEPESIITIQDENRQDIIHRLKATLDAKTLDMLIIYYTGHGFNKPGSPLYLMARDSLFDTPSTALSFNDLWELTCQKANKLLYILDCCRSGNALQDTEWTAEALKIINSGRSPHRMISVLTATCPNFSIKTPVGSCHTTFTDHLIELLEKGCGPEPAFLTPLKVSQELKERLGPNLVWHHDFHTEPLHIAHNRAYKPEEVKIENARKKLAVIKTLESYLHKDAIITLQTGIVSDLFDSLRLGG